MMLAPLDNLAQHGVVDVGDRNRGASDVVAQIL